MRYEILGPLRVVDRSSTSYPTARKVAIVLAALLLRTGQLVSAEQLTGEIWEGEPPRSASASLYVYISQLRKFLHRPNRPDPIVTCKPGYVLHVGAMDQFDLHEFQQLASAGRQHMRVQRCEEAAAAFETALRLWRGPALGDLRDGPINGGFTTWLEETRLECLESLIEAGLTLGRHRELVGQLYSLTAEHPLREMFHYQLMLALYRSERQADALAAYQTARTCLNEQVGIEPGRVLRRLQRAILASDHRLDLHHHVRELRGERLGSESGIALALEPLPRPA